VPGFCSGYGRVIPAVLGCLGESTGRPSAALQATPDAFFIAGGWPKLCNFIYKGLAVQEFHESSGVRESSGFFDGNFVFGECRNQVT
jgi:hypothetical protein